MTIETQIRDLARDIDDAQTPITGMAIRTGTTRTETVSERRMPALAWAALAAAAVAILLLPILFFGGSEADVVTTLPTTVPSTTIPDTTIPDVIPDTTVPEALPGASTLTVEWQEVVFDGIDGPRFRNGHTRLVAGDGRFLVLDYGLEGQEPNEGPEDVDGDSETVLWTSTDGTTWESHPVVIPGAAEGAWPELRGEVGGQVVILQYVYDDGTSEYAPGKPGGSSLFASSDLVTWTKLDVPPSDMSSSYRHMWTTDTAVLFRRGVFDTETESVSYHLVVGSADLTEFEVVEWPFGGDPGSQSLRAAATSDRFYALVNGTVWSSSDGRTWVVEDVGGERIEEIASNDEMVLVLGEQFWHAAQSGRPFEQAARRTSNTDADQFQVVGGSSGFVWYGVSGLTNPTAVTMVGPYVTTNGHDWNLAPIDSASAAVLHWYSSGFLGEWFLAPSGSWAQTWDEETESVTSVVWVGDGGWVLGRIVPAG